MKKIIIYDISAIINSGTKANHSKTYNIAGVPTGGLYKLFNYIIKDKPKEGEDTAIVACMDSKLVNSIRRKILPTYKSNRGIKNLNLASIQDSDSTSDIYHEITLTDYLSLTPTDQEKVALASNVNIQLRLCAEWLPKLGITVLQQDGFEADDLIYSTVISTLEDKPDILIRADDYDLLDCYSYNNNTKFESVSSRGMIEPKSGVMFHKLFEGCVSDTIPRLSSKYMVETVVVQRAIIDGIINPFDVHNTDNTLNTELFKDLEISEDSVRALLANFYCVVPFIFNVRDYIQPTNIDMNYLKFLLGTLRMKKLSSRIGNPLGETMSEDCKDLLYEIKRTLPVFTTKYFGSKLYNV